MMINKSQALKLEDLQEAALKVIFGYNHSYATLLEQTGLESLHDRRQRLTDSFLIKTVENLVYREKWFPRHAFYHQDLRKELIFHEDYARTPIFYYRRRLNEIYDLSARVDDGN